MLFFFALLYSLNLKVTDRTTPNKLLKKIK